MSNDVVDAIAKLKLKKDDILLVDAHKVDVSSLAKMPSRWPTLIIPVSCQPGQSPAESFAALSKTEALNILNTLASL